ncbi:MAG: hypothetical protein Q9208_002181 [Pyrenodesmia sp. 3 TL-2023]
MPPQRNARPQAIGYRTSSLGSRDCNAPFDETSNLPTYQRKSHEFRETVFIHCDPATGSRRRSIFRSTDPVSKLVRPFLSASSFERASQSSRSHTRFDGRASSAAAQDPRRTGAFLDRPPSRQGTPLSAASSGEPVENPEITGVPAYDVKQSTRKRGEQQRGLDWLSYASKQRFDRIHSAILARWGVGPEHQGTCVLLPEAWRFSAPLDLMALLNAKDVSLSFSRSPRAWYSYRDHATTLARAKVWHAATWPRSGIELDNFLGCGPYKAMDASHLCHHRHCIVHVVYEPAHVNADRNDCFARARFLRAEGRPIDRHCYDHEPPCLLQHAALTSLEAFHIQASVFCQAKGLPAPEPTPRPRRYPFPTFESTLPCNFPAIGADPAALVPEMEDDSLRGRPNLTCAFCSRLRGYGSIVGLWSHIFHCHQEVSSNDRVGEIRRTGALWEDYWDSLGGKKYNPTADKLEQMRRSSFGWNGVIAWDLR